MDAAVCYDKADYDWQMLADVSQSLPINSQFESITHFTLTPIAIEDEHNLFGFYLGGNCLNPEVQFGGVDCRFSAKPNRLWTSLGWMTK